MKVPTGNTGPIKVHILASPPHATATRIPSNLLNNNEKEKRRQAAGEREGKNKGLEGGTQGTQDLTDSMNHSPAPSLGQTTAAPGSLRRLLWPQRLGQLYMELLSV